MSRQIAQVFENKHNAFVIVQLYFIDFQFNIAFSIRILKYIVETLKIRNWDC